MKLNHSTSNKQTFSSSAVYLSMSAFGKVAFSASAEYTTALKRKSRYSRTGMFNTRKYTNARKHTNIHEFVCSSDLTIWWIRIGEQIQISVTFNIIQETNPIHDYAAGALSVKLAVFREKS